MNQKKALVAASVVLIIISSLVLLKGVVLASYSNDVASDNAVSHWNFSESSGNLLDQIGSANGTPLNNPTQGAIGQVGNSYSFNPSSSQGVNLADNVFNTQTQGAIEAIVKFNSATSQYVIFGQGNSNGGGGSQLYVSIDSGRVRLHVRQNGGAYWVNMRGSSVLTAGNWYHIVASVGPGGSKIYVNGVEDSPYTVDSGSSSSTAWFSSSTSGIATAKYAIGYLNRQTPALYMNGSIDELAIYDTVPNPSVWQAHYNAAFGEVTPTDSITLTSPESYRVFQRDETGHADISITGTYIGSPTAIEAQWNGGTWTTISTSPTGGTFSGNLTNQLTGQGNLSVRFVNDTTVSASSSHVGIGDVFVIAGQSNASGRASANQTYSNATIKAGIFANNDHWQELADPTDSNVGQIDSISGDSASGSVWPLVATQILSSQNVPVAFIPAAKGGSSIAEWQRNDSSPLSTSTLYGSMYRRINKVGNIKAVLFWQGENDVVNGTSQLDYRNKLTELTDDIRNDFGVNTVVAQIGDYAAYSGDNLNNIRLAQQDLFNTDNVITGPVLYDTNLSDEGGDGVHFKSAADVQIAAARWWAAIEAGLYGGNDGRGPQLIEATHNGAKTEINLTFTDQSLPISPSTGLSGFTVKDNGTPIAISSVTRTADDKIMINLASAASGTITVSLGSGHSGTGADVPRDSSPNALPAEIFIDQSVIPDDTTEPTGGITINNGDSTANSTLVSLSVDANDETDDNNSLQMMISNDSGFSGASWENYASTKSWNLNSEDGIQTVYIKLKDTSDNISLSYSDTITLDKTAPDEVSVLINTGNTTTNSRNVILSISATDSGSGISSMMISEDSGFSGASWENYADTKSLTLSPGDGTKNVFIRVMDIAGNPSSTAQASIELDSTAPQISNIVVSSSDTSITVSWGTDKPTSAQLEYGISTAFGQSSDLVDTSPMTHDHNLIASQLKTCTKYYFRLVSTDLASNQAFVDRETMTSGCPSSSSEPEGNSNLPNNKESNDNETTLSLLNRLGTTAKDPGETLEPETSSDNNLTDLIPLLSVKIVDDEGSTIEGAEVELHSVPKKSYTNTFGIATFQNVERKTQTVTISFSGKTFTQKLDLGNVEFDENSSTVSVTVSFKPEESKVIPSSSIYHGLLWLSGATIIFSGTYVLLRKAYRQRP